MSGPALEHLRAAPFGRPLVAGGASGGPAGRAGVRAGDVVIEVEGRAIENIYDYTYSLDGLRVGIPAKIVVRRGDSETAVMLTPTSRD